jgi:hypothetical protein
MSKQKNSYVPCELEQELIQIIGDSELPTHSRADGLGFKGHRLT